MLLCTVLYAFSVCFCMFFVCFLCAFGMLFVRFWCTSCVLFLCFLCALFVCFFACFCILLVCFGRRLHLLQLSGQGFPDNCNKCNCRQAKSAKPNKTLGFFMYAFCVLFCMLFVFFLYALADGCFCYNCPARAFQTIVTNATVGKRI